MTQAGENKKNATVVPTTSTNTEAQKQVSKQMRKIFPVSFAARNLIPSTYKELIKISQENVSSLTIRCTKNINKYITKKSMCVCVCMKIAPTHVTC